MSFWLAVLIILIATSSGSMLVGLRLFHFDIASALLVAATVAVAVLVNASLIEQYRVEHPAGTTFAERNLPGPTSLPSAPPAPWPPQPLPPPAAHPPTGGAAPVAVSSRDGSTIVAPQPAPGHG